MRLAVVSDIHGNLTAFEAVLADLSRTAPDLILHGGDLAQGGARPAAIVDYIRDLGWQGVLGNVDEALFRSESLEEFARQSPAPPSLWDAVREMTAAAREALGETRLAWLRGLPLAQIQGPMAVVHASPNDCWRAPSYNASDAELASVYKPLGQPVAVYGHIHHPFVRKLSGITVANSGSVGLPYDGDPRAAYLLIDDEEVAIQRVEYNVAKEVRILADSGVPHSNWVARMLECAAPQPVI
jgi:predicted phosphodiesterase